MRRTMPQHRDPADRLADAIMGMADDEILKLKIEAGAIRAVLIELRQREEINATLENICEHMATEHIAFGVVGRDEKVHPDWCVQCVFDGMRDLLTEYAQWGHEHSHNREPDEGVVKVPGSWEQCPMPTCQAAKEAIERGRNRI
jgi:hypothetical protein